MSTRCQLPVPGVTGGLTGLLMARRSVRDYAPGELSIEEVARLLWAGQGLSHSSGGRSAPSAHALYPLTLYLVAAEVEVLERGLYVYEPRAHALHALGHGDLRGLLCDAALEDQPWLRQCAAMIVVAGDVDRAADEFAEQPPAGRRGERYVYMEAGAAAQNIALAAAELALGTVLVGGFDDARVSRCLGVEAAPLLMMPLGRLRR